MMGQDNFQVAEQQQNYYDSIETDEFVMPNKFEVEIRLADNQVSKEIKKCFRNLSSNFGCLITGQNRDCSC